AQTLGWQMRWVYLVLPLAFVLMSLRILQVNYLKLVLGRDPRDPDKVDVEDLQQQSEGGQA
ncbi:MAG: TRAP transporter small permease, partial [Marivivens sp.]|nr:TRAP transporter small permease [Marivivens sp.]